MTRPEDANARLKHFREGLNSEHMRTTMKENGFLVRALSDTEAATSPLGPQDLTRLTLDGMRRELIEQARAAHSEVVPDGALIIAMGAPSVERYPRDHFTAYRLSYRLRSLNDIGEDLGAGWAPKGATIATLATGGDHEGPPIPSAYVYDWRALTDSKDAWVLEGTLWENMFPVESTALDAIL